MNKPATKAQRRRCDEKFGKLARRFRKLIDWAETRDMGDVESHLEDAASAMAHTLSLRDKDFEACKWSWIADATGCECK